MEISMFSLRMDDVASCTRARDGKFHFLELTKGNFVWSDPASGGDNTIVPFDGTYNEWLNFHKVRNPKDCGANSIREYCGNEVIVKQDVVIVPPKTKYNGKSK